MTSTPIGAGLRKKMGLFAGARDQQPNRRVGYEMPTAQNAQVAEPPPKTSL